MAWIVHLLQLLTISIGSLKLDFSPQIVGGERAKLGEIPYQVSLQDITSFHFCGGSVLNEKYVITAAHCVVNQSPSGLKVIAGSIDLNDPKVTYDVDKIIVHERYDFSKLINDIALLRVKNEFKKTDNVGFVSLPTKDFVVNANDIATVSGWGRLWLGGPTTNKLQRVDIVIADQNNCANKYSARGYNVYATQVCGYDSRTEKGSCHGDSGGPLTVRGKLVGLVSWAIGCASTSYPTVYTRVPSYIDWIKSKAV